MDKYASKLYISPYFHALKPQVSSPELNHVTSLLYIFIELLYTYISVANLHL